MIENIVLLVLGFIAGMVFILVVLPAEKEEMKIEQIQPIPVIHKMDYPIRTVYAEYAVPMEYLIAPLDSRMISDRLKDKLSDEIWKYSMVTQEINRREMFYKYKAVLKVVDMGNMNPLCPGRERYEIDFDYNAEDC